MESIKKIQRIISSVLFCLGLCSLLLISATALKPSEWVGLSWEDYLRQPSSTIDILLIGNSHSYSTIAPARIWSQKQITSWHVGASAINTDQKLAYLTTALQTQTPQLVAVEMYPLDSPVKRDYINNYWAYRDLPWSTDKISAILETTSPRDYEKVLFPILGYHNQWEQLSKTSIRNNFLASQRTDRFFAGAAPRTDIPKEIESINKNITNQNIDKTTVETNIRAFKKIAELCKKRNINLLFWVSPVSNPLVYKNYEKIRDGILEDYPTVRFVNTNMHLAEIGIQQSDFRDAGHLYLSGMIATTDWLTANHLAPYVSATKHSKGIASMWDRQADLWEQFETKHIAPE